MRIAAPCQDSKPSVHTGRDDGRYRRPPGYDAGMRRKWFVPVVSVVLAAVVFMVVFGLLAFILLVGESA